METKRERTLSSRRIYRGLSCYSCLLNISFDNPFSPTNDINNNGFEMSFIIDSKSLRGYTHSRKLDEHQVGRNSDRLISSKNKNERRQILRENNLLTAFNDSKIDSQTIMECISDKSNYPLQCSSPSAQMKIESKAKK